jgi:Concanavalin A-like lectin/glucanases superfamily/Glycine rich protein
MPKVMRFDSTGDYVITTGLNTSETNFSRLGQFTLEGWFKKTAQGSDNPRAIALSKGVTYFDIGYTNNKLMVSVDISGQRTYETPYVPVLNVWTHYAMTYDGAFLKVFVNAEEVFSVNIVGSATNNDNLTLGRFYAGGYTYVGDMADIRVWDVARTSTQIKSYYKKRLNGNEDGLFIYYPLRDNMNLVTDHSASNKHGTIYNSTYIDINDLPIFEDSIKIPLGGGSGGQTGQTVYTAPNGVTVTSSNPVWDNSNYYYMGYMFEDYVALTDEATHYWLTNSSGNTTLTFDFNSLDTPKMSKIAVYPRTRNDASSNYRILGSNDGNGWEELVPWIDTSTSTPYGTRHSYDINTTYRYYRFELTRNGSWGATLGEIEFFCQSWNFNNTSTGRYGSIQSYTVPKTGIYRITAIGARGGKPLGVSDASRGKGARMEGEFELAQGDVLKIVVGQEGLENTSGNNANGGGAGGGGSFVWINNQTAPLIVAGGGGGASIDNTSYNMNLTMGRGGTTAINGLDSWGENLNNFGVNGGDATYSNGARGWNSMISALNFDGKYSSNYNMTGGFGGGGLNLDGNHAGGGGGGYSGGGGGQYNINNGGNADGRDGGGGGGSFNLGDNQTNYSNYNDGHGKVIVSFVRESGLRSTSKSLGTGKDGDIILSGGNWHTTNFGKNNGFAEGVDSYINSSVPLNARSFSLASVSGLNVGDEILIHFDHSTNYVNRNTYAGMYMFAFITSISGNNVYIDTGLEFPVSYSADRVQVVRVPNYRNVIVTGRVYGNAWNWWEGGIIAFRANGKVDFNGGYIDADNIGYRCNPVLSMTDAYATMGMGRNPDHGSSNSGYGGGGGTHGQFGGYGVYNSTISNSESLWNNRSSLIGDSSMEDKIFLGASGGYGVRSHGSSDPTENQRGGYGGGIVIIFANTIDFRNATARILANGEGGKLIHSGASWETGGGGGAGGSVYLSVSNIVNMPNYAVSATGGGGGANTSSSGTFNGGNGLYNKGGNGGSRDRSAGTGSDYGSGGGGAGHSGVGENASSSYGGRGGTGNSIGSAGGGGAGRIRIDYVTLNGINFNGTSVIPTLSPRVGYSILSAIPPTISDVTVTNDIHDTDVNIRATIDSQSGTPIKYNITIDGVKVYPVDDFYTEEKVVPHQIDVTLPNGLFKVGSNLLIIEALSTEGASSYNSTDVNKLNEKPIIHIISSNSPVHKENFHLEFNITDFERDLNKFKVSLNGEEQYGWTLLRKNDEPNAIVIRNHRLLSGENTLRIDVEDSLGSSSFRELVVTKGNNEPEILLDYFSGYTLGFNISDQDNDRVSFEILINGVNQTHFEDYISTPYHVTFYLDPKLVNAGEENTIKISARDEIGDESFIEEKRIMQHYGLLFCDETESVYSNHIGDVLQVLVHDTIVAGNASPWIEIWVKNNLGYDVGNVVLTAIQGELDPIHEKVELAYPTANDEAVQSVNIGTLHADEKKSFFIRVNADLEAVVGGNFYVNCKGQPVL